MDFNDILTQTRLEDNNQVCPAFLCINYQRKKSMLALVATVWGAPNGIHRISGKFSVESYWPVFREVLIMIYICVTLNRDI
jgi:hypothetical protein